MAEDQALHPALDWEAAVGCSLDFAGAKLREALLEKRD